MDLGRFDLNLLVYLDALLREGSVTRAAERLNITQPAMSNGLRRLRDLFDDPLLIRTSEGMQPTERALALQPLLREVLGKLESVVQPVEFEPGSSDQLFRIVASDYAESTLLPRLLAVLRDEAPHVALDILTASDALLADLETGKVDLAINRFDHLPRSCHHTTLWRDTFSCLVSNDNPALQGFTLESYLHSAHIWVSKTGMGAGTGMAPRDASKLGWVDVALAELGHSRRIRIYTRHYQVAALLAQQPDLIATLPTQVARLYDDHPQLTIRRPPFAIAPIELKMAWSPLLQHNHSHVWFRRLIQRVAREIAGSVT